MRKSKFLRSTCLAAILVAGLGYTDGLRAQEPSAPTQFLSVEGGVILAEPSVDKVGSFSEPPVGFEVEEVRSGPPELFPRLDEDFGYYAAIMWGGQISPRWDLRLGVSLNRFDDNDDDISLSDSFDGKASFDETEGSVRLDQELGSDLDFYTADVELGYKALENQAFNLRFFAGLRGLAVEESAEKMGYFELRDDPDLIFSFDFDREIESDFLGLGPRVGTNFEARIGDTALGISGMLAGAAIFGSRDTKSSGAVEVCYDDGGGLDCLSGSGTSRDSEGDIVYNLEGNIGVDMHVTDSSKFTVGYRAQQWWDIRAGDDDEGIDKLGVDDDVLVHGPFARYTGQF